MKDGSDLQIERLDKEFYAIYCTFPKESNNQVQFSILRILNLEKIPMLDPTAWVSLGFARAPGKK